MVGEDGATIGGGVVAEITADSQVVCPCPFGKGQQIYETDSTYQCKCDESCKEEFPKIKKVAILPKIVCKREMKPEEAVLFFSEGITPEFDDFTSRYGRPFKAKLKLKDNGKHGFEFAPRAPKKKKKAGAKKKTKKTKKKSTTGKKKSAKKKSSKKKSSTKKKSPGRKKKPAAKRKMKVKIVAKKK